MDQMLRQEQKNNETKVNKVWSALYLQILSCCTETLLNIPLLLSFVKTQTCREAKCCQTTQHIFSPEVKRQLQRSPDPKKMGSVTECSSVIVHAVRSLFFLIAAGEKIYRSFYTSLKKNYIKSIPPPTKIKTHTQSGHDFKNLAENKFRASLSPGANVLLQTITKNPHQKLQ